MSPGFIIILLTIFFIMNTYHDGKYITMMKTWTKYYKMFGIGFAGLSAYIFFKKNPSDTRTMLTAASGLMKHIPIDKETASVINPMLDLTGANNKEEHRIMTSGGGGTKRSVSETKKKYVASNQNWKCGNCQAQLDHTFEIDHKIRLEYGGGNDVQNLIALCRNCHGRKTANENM